MSEEEATSVAEALGGEAWNSAGNIWLVMLWRKDGKLVVVSDDVVCEYPSQDAFDAAQPSSTIVLH